MLEYGQICSARDSTGSRAIGLPWYGWHGFRRGIASNLCDLGANDKIVERILRHANQPVTKERYIKTFDPAVLEAMQQMRATLDVLEKSLAVVQHQMELRKYLLCY